MTVQEQPYPVVSLVIDTFGEWLKHRRELKEMREMDAANFDRIASELRMSSADLEALVRQGPHAADELPKMLQALGVDQQPLLVDIGRSGRKGFHVMRPVNAGGGGQSDLV